jgi:glutamine cyclotransferase
LEFLIDLGFVKGQGVLLNHFMASFGFSLALIGTGQTSLSATPKVVSFDVVRELPHDPLAFTQGLEIWEPGYFLETTGMYGKSELRKVEVETGRVVLRRPLSEQYFGEGATKFGSDIIQLTWREGVALRWSISQKSKDLTAATTQPWDGEGWGLTRGSSELWASDGSSQLRVIEPKQLKVKRRVSVTLAGKPMDRLNELEMVEGKIFANVWMTSTIVRIDPKSGVIDGLMDISRLIPKNGSPEAVANGIAWDQKKRRLYVTGKLWPKVFELKLKN